MLIGVNELGTQSRVSVYIIYAIMQVYFFVILADSPKFYATNVSRRPPLISASRLFVKVFFANVIFC